MRSHPMFWVSSASWRMSFKAGRRSGVRCDSRIVRYVRQSVAGGRGSVIAFMPSEAILRVK